MTRLENSQMFECIGREHLAILPPATMMTLQNPKKRTVVAEKCAAKRLAIAAPQFLAAHDAPQTSRRRAPERHADRVVEPHDRRRARPHELAHRAVVAFDDPLFARDELLHFVAEAGARRPVLAPMQPVELDVLASEALGERASEVSFAGTRAADDDNSRMFR